MEHFMKKSYRRSLQMSIIRWKIFLKSRKIKGRPKEVLVRWLHWPSKYDSWVPATTITGYYK